MKPRVTVADYGLGNLHSVVKAFAHVGAEVEIAQDGRDLLFAERIVVPGVGAFADGMSGLERRGMVAALRKLAGQGRPIVGICLGAQLLLSESEEFGRHKGLDIIAGSVLQIPAQGVKVPHVGWDRLHVPQSADWTGTPLSGTEPGTWAYFVHSFMLAPAEPRHVLAICRYGPFEIPAVVSTGRITGFQFHPEKSGQAGLEILRQFIQFPV